MCGPMLPPLLAGGTITLRAKFANDGCHGGAISCQSQQGMMEGVGGAGTCSRAVRHVAEVYPERVIATLTRAWLMCL